MKTILVLTDFSKMARFAADAAISIAGKLKTDVLLLNTFMSVPIVPSAEAANWQVQDYVVEQHISEENLENERQRLLDLLKGNVSEPGKPVIRTQSAYGGLVDNVKTCLKENAVELIVMGGREPNGLPFLFGDAIKAVINHVKKPVLVVPHPFNFDETINVTFATDLENSDLKSLKELGKLAAALNSQIHVVHVMEPVIVPDFREEEDTDNFRQSVSRLKIERLTYQTLHGENISDQLVKYNRELQAGLMAMVHKPHSFLWRLFNEKPCQEMIARHKIPLLVYPEQH